MNNTEFTKLVEERIVLIRGLLNSKGKEYAPGADRMHNFDLGQQVAPWLFKNREEYALGLALKHFGSVMDILELQYNDGAIPSEEYIKEKFGDLINYLIIMELSLIDKQRPSSHYAGE